MIKQQQSCTWHEFTWKLKEQVALFVRRSWVVIPGVVCEVIGRIGLTQVGNEIVHKKIRRETLTHPSIIVLTATSRIIDHSGVLSWKHLQASSGLMIKRHMMSQVGWRYRRIEHRYRRINVRGLGSLRLCFVQASLLIRIHVLVEFRIKQVSTIHGTFEFLMTVATVCSFNMRGKLLITETMKTLIFIVGIIGEF